MGSPVSDAGRGTVQGAGVELSFHEWRGEGTGPALLLLHGITGSGADWRPVVRQCLLQGAGLFSRVVALDARGHGRSGWDPGADYSGDSHFADAVLAIDQLGLQGCVVAGYSMGGGVAMMVAGGRPGVCAGLVVVDTYPDTEMTPGSYAIARTLARWWEAYARGDGDAGPAGGWTFDPAIARAFADNLAAGRANRLDLWPFWRSLRCPALLIRGELSRVMPREVADRMIAAQPRARLVEIRGAGHILLTSAAAVVARAICQFLMELSSPSALPDPEGAGDRHP